MGGGIINEAYHTQTVGNTYNMYGTMQATSPSMYSGSKYAPNTNEQGLYFRSADDFLQQSTGYSTTIDAASTLMKSSRPTDPAIGELAPIGDIILPMLLCLFAYTVCKMRKQFTNYRRSL